MDKLGAERTFEALKWELLSAVDWIEELDSLVPSPRTDEAFGRLVGL